MDIHVSLKASAWILTKWVEQCFSNPFTLKPPKSFCFMFQDPFTLKNGRPSKSIFLSIVMAFAIRNFKICIHLKGTVSLLYVHITLLWKVTIFQTKKWHCLYLCKSFMSGLIVTWILIAVSVYNSLSCIVLVETYEENLASHLWLEMKEYFDSLFTSLLCFFNTVPKHNKW